MCGPTIPFAAFQGAELVECLAKLPQHLERLISVQRRRARWEHGDRPAPVLDELGDRQFGHCPAA